MSKFRDKTYKEDPELARLTDFSVIYENKLKTLHKKYIKDTGEEMPFLAFVVFIYNNAQDLVIEPELN